jgi:hypothetical protein
MVKEPKNIDFYTTGRQPSKEDFARVSVWIKKQKQAAKKPKRQPSKQKSHA